MDRTSSRFLDATGEVSRPTLQGPASSERGTPPGVVRIRTQAGDDRLIESRRGCCLRVVATVWTTGRGARATDDLRAPRLRVGTRALTPRKAAVISVRGQPVYILATSARKHL